MATRRKKQVEVEAVVQEINKGVVANDEADYSSKQTNSLGSKSSVEKTPEKVKENCPLIIIKSINDKGDYVTRQYTCSNIEFEEFKKVRIKGASKNTTLSISINADVVEVM